VYRSGSPTTGYFYLGNSGTHYFGYDGTNFIMSGTGALYGPASGFVGNLNGSAASASILTPGNDLTVYRSGSPTTGYFYLGNSGTHYFGFDGTNFTMSGTGGLYGPSSGFVGNLYGNVTGNITGSAGSANALNTSNSYTVASLNISDNAGNQLTLTNTAAGSKYLRINPYSALEIVNSAYSAVVFAFDDAGNFFAVNNIYGAAKYFKITHPLASKAETTDLVHISVESPQADLIYRGQTALQNGSSVVNIDSVAGMTDGTFVALCENVQCFTTNETGWTLVRGAVNGNLLTIDAQDATCSDMISWMVVGTRKDVNVVVEPAKATKATGLNQAPV
jgi:hypothetical protein